MLGNCYFYVKSITFFTNMEFNKHIRISVEGIIPFGNMDLTIGFNCLRSRFRSYSQNTCREGLVYEKSRNFHRGVPAFGIIV